MRSAALFEPSDGLGDPIVIDFVNLDAFANAS
jgi:hypothetical protein